MRVVFFAVAAAVAVHPALVQAGDGHGVVAQDETSAVKGVLAAYKAALERRDATGTEQLFMPDSTIYENGGSEGTYSNYLAHHLGPELKEFKSFAFSNYRVSVRIEGQFALATETYGFRIETVKGEVVERQGVATSLLKKVGREWKILTMHSSSRRPAAR